MNLTPTTIDTRLLPAELKEYISGYNCYDSSCSAEANVIFIEREEGYFLKRSFEGSLKREYEMTSYFNSLSLAPNPVLYLTEGGKDYLLTKAAKGKDCTHYTHAPARLAETTGAILKDLHSLKADNCPQKNRTAEYLSNAEFGYNIKRYDESYCGFSARLLGNKNFKNADDAFEFLNAKKHLLSTDKLIHGDYCLPNVLLNDFSFSSFIDLGASGIADKHIDIYWGLWTLEYNLGTAEYTDAFLRAYGKGEVDLEKLMIIGAAESFG